MRYPVTVEIVGSSPIGAASNKKFGAWCDLDHITFCYKTNYDT